MNLRIQSCLFWAGVLAVLVSVLSIWTIYVGLNTLNYNALVQQCHGNISSVMRTYLMFNEMAKDYVILTIGIVLIVFGFILKKNPPMSNNKLPETRAQAHAIAA